MTSSIPKSNPYESDGVAVATMAEAAFAGPSPACKTQKHRWAFVPPERGGVALKICVRCCAAEPATERELLFYRNRRAGIESPAWATAETYPDMVEYEIAEARQERDRARVRAKARRFIQSGADPVGTTFGERLVVRCIQRPVTVRKKGGPIYTSEVMVCVLRCGCGNEAMLTLYTLADYGTVVCRSCYRRRPPQSFRYEVIPIPPPARRET